MYQTIGKTGIVVNIFSNSIYVKFDDNTYLYPFTALERVKEDEPDVPNTDRYVLFLSSDDEWEMGIGFYCNELRYWKVRGGSLGYLKLADGEVVKWEELPSKED